MTDIRHITTDGLRRMRRLASANGWAEIAYDCREEQQRRVAERG